MNWLPRNEISNQHYYGLLLNNSCQIPFQENKTTTSKNIDNLFNWIPSAGNLLQTYVFGGTAQPNATSNGLRVQNTGAFIPTTNSAFPIFNKYSLGVGLLTPTTTIVNATCPFVPLLITGPIVHTGVITGALTAPAAYPDENYIAKKNIYNMLKMPGSSIDANSTISAFYNTCNVATHAYRNLWDIEAAVSSEDYTTATNLANAFAASNEVEANYKNYALLSGRFYGTQNATAADMQALLNIAMACPHTKGNIVYQARAMHNALNPDNVVIFGDNCDGSGLYKTTPKSKIIAAQAFDAIIYPNPSENIIYISTTLQIDEVLLIEVIDITGKTIIKQNCITTSNNCFVNLKPNTGGIYFVKITNNKNESITKKVVLQ
jgi:Secretion system C-terminal sorting domain